MGHILMQVGLVTVFISMVMKMRVPVTVILKWAYS